MKTCEIRCTRCNSIQTKKKGRTSSGTQRYQCKKCGKTFSLDPKRSGPKPIYDRPMTNAEKQRRWRENNKALSQAFDKVLTNL